MSLNDRWAQVGAEWSHRHGHRKCNAFARTGDVVGFILACVRDSWRQGLFGIDVLVQELSLAGVSIPPSLGILYVAIRHPYFHPDHKVNTVVLDALLHHTCSATLVDSKEGADLVWYAETWSCCDWLLSRGFPDPREGRERDLVWYCLENDGWGLTALLPYIRSGVVSLDTGSWKHYCQYMVSAPSRRLKWGESRLPLLGQLRDARNACVAELNVLLLAVLGGSTDVVSVCLSLTVHEHSKPLTYNAVDTATMDSQ